MRAIITLMALVFTVAVTVGQDEVEPSSPPVNPVCELAFARAARDPGELHATPSPTSGIAAGSAGPSSSPGLGSSPGPSPSPFGGSTILDDAIKSCSGVDDFAGAAALHPDVLDDVDVLDFIAARCADASAGLAGYATCASLRRLLATPAPTAVPTPVPLPTPRATATPKPAKQPKGTKKPGPKATPKPTAGPVVTIDVEPRIGVARVPARYRASVPGATRVHYFAIRGKTPQGLLRSLTRQAGNYCGPHTAACVQTRYAVRPTYVQDPYAGTCTIVGVTVPLTFVAHIPRWTAPSRVPTYMVWWWKKAAARIGWHEAQHVKIAKRHAARLPGMVVGKPCSRFGTITQRWSRSLVEAQNAFDRLDYPRSDRAMSRWWRQAYSRFFG